MIASMPPQECPRKKQNGTSERKSRGEDRDEEREKRENWFSKNQLTGGGGTCHKYSRVLFGHAIDANRNEYEGKTCASQHTRLFVARKKEKNKKIVII